MILNGLIDDTTRAISQQVETDYWVGSRFEEVAHYKPDPKGKWGELLLHNLLTLAGIPHTWDGDSNTNPDDGIYDIKLDTPLPRLEAKTSTRNASGGFQHDGIYSTPLWDVVAFVDVSYDCIYLTLVSYDCLLPILVPGDAKHPEFGKGATLRENHTDDYKFDFSQRTITQGIKHGHTFVIDPANEDLDALKAFLYSKLT